MASQQGSPCPETNWFRRHLRRILAIALALALALQYAFENLPYIVRILNWILAALHWQLILILPAVLSLLRLLLQFP